MRRVSLHSRADLVWRRGSWSPDMPERVRQRGEVDGTLLVRNSMTTSRSMSPRSDFLGPQGGCTCTGTGNRG